MPSPRPTVAKYLIQRLKALGIDHAFGVPGDYSFPIDNAVESCAGLSWILCSNELNAAYAADGYARRRGAAILTTTYAVGELSALNGVMGSRAHSLPVFHLVGAPSTRIGRRRLVTHHSLGDGDWGRFRAISEASTCVSAVLTAENAIAEVERCIREALRLSQPAYLLLPDDEALKPVRGTIPRASRPTFASDPIELRAALDAVLVRMKASRLTVILPTIQVQRRHAIQELLDLLKRTGIPYASMPMDKGILSEGHPSYLGLYNGDFSEPADVRQSVEQADLVIDVGGIVREDLNAGLWSDRLREDRIVTLGPDFVQVGDAIFTSVMLADILAELARKAPAGKPPKISQPPQNIPGKAKNERISSATLYPRIRCFLRKGDTLIAETGTCMLHLSRMRLPDGVAYESQTLWGSIGWATPAALGTSLAEPDRRTILITGDGSHQLTATELGVMGRYGIRPIIIVLNNGIYGIEDVLSEKGHVYDDLAPWKYHTLPAAMGCADWFCAKVSTLLELDDALTHARRHDGAAYLEIVIPPEESLPLPRQLIERFHLSKTPQKG